jgi:hypothetical protein
LFSAACALLSAEPALCFTMPDDECSHNIFVCRRPTVFEVDAWKSVVTWFVCIKGLVLIEEVILCQEARVDVTVLEVEIRYALMMNVRQLFAYSASQDIAEDEQRTSG